MIELNRIYNESNCATLQRMPDAVVDCVITSPPYWQLRDYGVEGQWGLEPTYQEYLQNLWNMMDEIWRVLKDDGTVWINLGDSYYGSGHGAWNKYDRGEISHKDEYYGDGRNDSPVTEWDYSSMKAKTLMLIPHRFAIGCIDRGWILRNDIVWAKRNAMPESVRDRFCKKHEYFFFMVKHQKYYFDLDAIREKYLTSENRPNGPERNMLLGYDSKFNELHKNSSTKIPEDDAEKYGSPRARQHRHSYLEKVQSGGKDTVFSGGQNNNGKNPGDVADFWDIPTKPNKDKHYASYNDELIKKPVLAGCREGGLIYDPFMGTGTTAYVALSAGRNYVGSELNPDYIKIAERRLQPLKAQLNMFNEAI